MLHLIAIKDYYKCSWPWHCTWFPSFK